MPDPGPPNDKMNFALTTLYAEISAGVGTHWSSGQMLRTQYAQVVSAVVNHYSLAATLPKLTASGTGFAGTRGVGAGVLPSLKATSYWGGTGAALLPMPTVAATMTVPNIGRTAATLPMLTISAHGLTGFLARTNIGILPKIRALGYGGNQGAAVLPKLTVVAHALQAQNWIASLYLPSLQALGVGHRSSESGRGAMTLPKLIAGTTTRVTVLLPRLLGTGLGTNSATVTQRAWVMNVRSGAMTEFPGYAFRVLVRWRNAYYGVGMSGNLYQIGGDLDVTAPIPWAFETGLEDLDNPAQKGVDGVYIEGKLERGATLTLVTDTDDRYVYATKAPIKADRRMYRVITGKGVRSSSFGFAMANALGGYMEVDRIAPRFVISKRNIG